MEYIPINLPFSVIVSVPYYRVLRDMLVVGYIPSKSGFLSHTTLVLRMMLPTGEVRELKRLEQTIATFRVEDVEDEEPMPGGLLRVLGII